MVYKRIAREVLLLVTINILILTLVDASPSGYARPSYLKGSGGNGAGMPYDGGPSPRDGAGYYPDGKDGRDVSSEYHAKGGEELNAVFLFQSMKIPVDFHHNLLEILHGWISTFLTIDFCFLCFKKFPFDNIFNIFFYLQHPNPDNQAWDMEPVVVQEVSCRMVVLVIARSTTILQFQILSRTFYTSMKHVNYSNKQLHFCNVSCNSFQNKLHFSVCIVTILRKIILL